MSKWDDKRIARARKALGMSTTIAEAAARLGCDSSALLNGWKRNAKGDPRELLKADPASTAPLRELQDRRRQASTLRELQSKLAAAEDQLHWMHSAAAHPPRIITPRSRGKSGLRAADPIFMISDTHFGEVVTRAGSLGLNEYNMPEALRRMAKCWDNMLWLRKDMARTTSCDHTYLAINGDIVTGSIHAELRETNERGGVRAQCDAAVDALAPGILAMADATPGILHIVCIGGNHGRATVKQQVKNGTEHSFEHIGVYDPLRRLIGDRKGKIAWHIPYGERHMFEMHGRRIAQQHGTMIRSAGGIGGPLVPMTRWVTRDAMADYYLFGHFHEADAYGRSVKNGSLIGDSDYSRWLGVDPKVPPLQVAFMIDAHAGLRRFERVSVT